MADLLSPLTDTLFWTVRSRVHSTGKPQHSCVMGKPKLGLGTRSSTSGEAKERGKGQRDDAGEDEASSDEGVGPKNQDEVALRLIELLMDEDVAKRLKKILFPKDMMAKIDGLYDEIAGLKSQIRQKDERITELEGAVVTLQDDLDDLQQYSRRSNLRIQGVSGG